MSEERRWGTSDKSSPTPENLLPKQRVVGSNPIARSSPSLLVSGPPSGVSVPVLNCAAVLSGQPRRPALYGCDPGPRASTGSGGISPCALTGKLGARSGCGGLGGLMSQKMTADVA